MDISLHILYALNAFLMIAIGVGLGYYLARKFQCPGRLWWIGAGTFIASQIGHIPFNILLTKIMQNEGFPLPPENWLLYFNAVVLGLSSGIWEECARYIMYRWWAKDARSWQKALLTGAGHGGIEAIILGCLALFAFIQMIAIRTIDLSTVLPTDQISIAQSQIEAYWSTPWYSTLLGALERVFTLCLHIANSVIVLQVFKRKQVRWLWLAIGWHAIMNGIAVIVNARWGPYICELILGICAVISLAIVFSLRASDENNHTNAPSSPVQPLEIRPVEESIENIDKSRFNSGSHP
ncbi:MAG: YhfC family intramembrane metalloprotease [Anaerolineales bacterium]|nr:YhfC family intramembrane metalloprotease [Anaerolineales bacterium]